MARVRALLRRTDAMARNARMESGRLDLGDLGIDPVAREVRLDHQPIELTGLKVVVIDDHSSDRTGAIARQYAVEVVTRRNMPNRGKSEALNAGLEIARGDVICVFDADSEVAPDFLRRAERKAPRPQ